MSNFKIDKLTAEQEALMPEYLAKWEKIGYEYKDIDKEKAEKLLKEYTALIGLKPNKFIYADSPYGCQKIINEMAGNKTAEYYPLYWRQSGNIQSGYHCFYDFIIEELVKKTGQLTLDAETLRLWEITKSITAELHYFFTFEEVIFISEKPLYIKIEDDLLHSESSPAVLYKDGNSLYFWRGISVPEQLIMNPESITKENLLNTDNAELRKCYMEKLGTKKYYDIISDGKGLRKLDSSIDQNGNVMTLWQTTEDDDIINEPIQFLECECPSTGDIFTIYPTRFDCKTALEAKESTFNNTKIAFRHGDVGIEYLNEEFSLPLIES